MSKCIGKPNDKITTYIAIRSQNQKINNSLKLRVLNNQDIQNTYNCLGNHR